MRVGGTIQAIEEWQLSDTVRRNCKDTDIEKAEISAEERKGFKTNFINWHKPTYRDEIEINKFSQHIDWIRRIITKDFFSAKHFELENQTFGKFTCSQFSLEISIDLKRTRCILIFVPNIEGQPKQTTLLFLEKICFRL